MWRLRTADGILGLAVFAAGLGLAFLSSDIPTNPGVHTLSAKFFPQLLALLLVLCGLALLVAPRRKLVGEAASAMLESRRVCLAVLVAAYFLSFRVVDFRVGTFAFALAAMWLLGARRWWELAAVAVAVSLGTYVLFRYGFTVLLPVWR